MEYKKYFNEGNEYQKPVLIKFDEPVKVKLCELDTFLSQYKPFNCSDVWLFQRFEYGDYDNWVSAIIESKNISPVFSQVYREEKGIYNAGDTSWCIVDSFWYYREDYPFWKFCPIKGYSSGIRKQFIDEIEINVYGVYVISWSDKEKIEAKER